MSSQAITPPLASSPRRPSLGLYLPGNRTTASSISSFCRRLAPCGHTTACRPFSWLAFHSNCSSSVRPCGLPAAVRPLRTDSTRNWGASQPDSGNQTTSIHSLPPDDVGCATSVQDLSVTVDAPGGVGVEPRSLPWRPRADSLTLSGDRVSTGLERLNEGLGLSFATSQVGDSDEPLEYAGTAGVGCRQARGH